MGEQRTNDTERLTPLTDTREILDLPVSHAKLLILSSALRRYLTDMKLASKNPAALQSSISRSVIATKILMDIERLLRS